MSLLARCTRTLLSVAATAAIGVSTAKAQTVVTSASPNGWVFFDGAGPGTDPAQITGTEPFGGNGSLQFTVSASNQQPTAGYFFATPIALKSLGSLSLGFDYLVPTGTVPASSPTIRLLLDGLSGPLQPSGKTFGSLGWYSNGVNDSWDTGSFDFGTGDFFFRIGGAGEAANDCSSVGSTFDDRRQTIASWFASCSGVNGTDNIDNAVITGVQVDWGTFSAPGTPSSFADAVNFVIGDQSGDFNFEQVGSVQSVTPEPATMSLMALGLVGLVGARRRKRAR